MSNVPDAGGLSATLARLEGRLCDWVERHTAGGWWILSVVLLSAAVSLFWSFPRFGFLPAYEQYDKTWQVIQWQAEHFLQPISADVLTHEAKRDFRLWQPFLMWISGLGVNFVLLVQFACGFLSIGFMTKIVFDLSGSRVAAALIGFAFAQTLAGKSAFIGLSGFGDGFSVFFLLAAMLSRNPAAIAIAAFAGMFNDERTVIACLAVTLFHCLDASGRLSIRRQALGMVAAYVAYGAVRLYLAEAHGLKTPVGTEALVGLSVFMKVAASVHLHFYRSYSGLFLLPLFLLVLACVRRRRLLALLTVATLGPVVAAAAMVFDFDRSLIYLLPMIPLALKWRWYDEPEIRRLGVIAALMCVATPASPLLGYVTIRGIGSDYYAANPMPVELGRWLFKSMQ